MGAAAEHRLLRGSTRTTAAERSTNVGFWDPETTERLGHGQSEERAAGAKCFVKQEISLQDSYLGAEFCIGCRQYDDVYAKQTQPRRDSHYDVGIS